MEPCTEPISDHAAIVPEPDKLPSGLNFLVRKPIMLEGLCSAITRLLPTSEADVTAGVTPGNSVPEHH